MIGTEEYEITAYLYAVRAALGDLSESTRDELLEDLPEHLAEVLAEAGGTLVERLGPPEAYASELRASAGFVGDFPDPPPDRAAEYRALLLGRLRVLDARVGPVLGYERASDFFVLLRPAWWVLRGYLAAMVLAWMLDGGSQPIGLIPRIGGSDLIALVLAGAAILGSIWLGRRSFAMSVWPRYALFAGTAVLVLVAIAGFAYADSSTRDAHYSDVNYDNGGGNPYGGVQDVFVYDGQGRLVTGAQLFDQDGTPIQLGSAYCTDEATGEQRHTDHIGYPYCPQSAPFKSPSGDRSAAPSPSASPSKPSAGPGPR